MTAKEMFECLGYKIVSGEDDKFIMYKKIFTDYDYVDEYDGNYNDWIKCTYKHYLVFDLAIHTFHAYSHKYLFCDEEYSKNINVLEMMAIKQQCEELGWF